MTPATMLKIIEPKYANTESVFIVRITVARTPVQ
jgi:hypothetical protein